MNKTDMIAEIRERLGESVGNEDFWKDTQIVRSLTEAMLRFSHEEKWPWLYTTQGNIPVAAGNPSIELIDDIDVTRHFNVTLTKDGDTGGTIHTPRRVTPIDALGLRQRHPGLTGEPRWWYATKTIRNEYGDGDVASAQIITLLPTPDVAYTAEYVYIRDPAPLVLDTDEPDLPAAYHGAIVAYATFILWEKELNGGPKAQEQWNIYQEILTQAKKDMKALALDETLVWGRAYDDYVYEPKTWYDVHLPGPVGMP